MIGVARRRPDLVGDDGEPIVRFAELAARWGISEATVRQHLSRSRRGKYGDNPMPEPQYVGYVAYYERSSLPDLDAWRRRLPGAGYRSDLHGQV